MGGIISCLTCGKCCGPPPKKEGEEDENDGKCVVTPNQMKLITLITLLVSDFDIVFTVFSCVSYYAAGGVFFLLIGVLGFFLLVYIGGCIIAAKESGKFMDRFKDKVRLNEIGGISMEDLEDALDARRIFWMGPDYESAKKRKIAIDNLKACTPDAAEPHEINIDDLERALREAEMAGASMLHMAGDPKFGERAVKKANEKLKAAKKAQNTTTALQKGLSRRGTSLGEADDVNVNYAPNKAKTRDEMEGRSGDNGKVDLEGVPGMDDANAEEDFAAKAFEEEIKEAEAANDSNLVKMLQLAMLKQLDSYKVDKKLLDKKGRVTDPMRALFMICEAKGILHSYHAASRAFSRRIVKPSHSVPYFRLMEFGWQPEVSHTDFAGILNANGLYSFTVGFPQMFFSIAFTYSTLGIDRTPAPCELDPGSKCSMPEDFYRPSVQFNICICSLIVGLISLGISLANIIIDFPAQLFDIAEKDEEALHFTLQAEHATKTWEEKLAVEVQENVKMMLKMSTQFENNSIPGMEAPGLVIEDVMKLERRAMEKKVAYIEHFITMSEDEKKLRNDLRDGKRKKKEEPADMAEEEEEAVRQPVPIAPPVQPQALPPPEPSQPPPRVASRIPSALPPPAEPEPEEEEPVAPPPTE